MSNFGIVNAWTKSIASILLAIAFFYVLQSFFISILIITFFFFIPHPDEDEERAWSSLIFSWGMAALLGMAFIDSARLGLGLNLDFGLGTIFGPQIPLLGPTISTIIILLLFARGLVYKVNTHGVSGMKTKSYIGFFIFFFITAMMIVFQAWTWDVSTIIFTGFWIVAFVAGSSGDIGSRQGMGMLMILLAFIIFSLGVGSQVVGGAVFGEWWPTVAQSTSGIFEPIGAIFGDASSGLRSAFLFVSCPSCYAQSIINGTFQTDQTTGIAGAFGVELTDLRMGPIFSEQPFSAIVKIQNKGAFEAHKVLVTIKTGLKPPVKQGVLTSEKANLADLGFRTFPEGATDPKDIQMKCEENTCIQGPDGNILGGSVEKLDIRQLFFESSVGMSCPQIVKYDLLKQYFPLTAIVDYDYSVESTMNVEFISQTEWDRVIKSGKIVTQAKTASQLTNAPVRLNIDTLEQPIREGTRFHIGLNLVSAKTKGIISESVIRLEIPTELTQGKLPKCSPDPGPPKISDSIVYTWSGKSVIFCNLEGFSFSSLAGSEKTFTIRANASYHFQEEKDFTPGKIEFTSYQCCATSDQCAAGMACTNNVCGDAAQPLTIQQQLDALRAKVDKLTQEYNALNTTLASLIAQGESGKTLARQQVAAIRTDAAAAQVIIDTLKTDPTVSSTDITDLQNIVDAMKLNADLLEARINAPSS